MDQKTGGRTPANPITGSLIFLTPTAKAVGFAVTNTGGSGIQVNILSAMGSGSPSLTIEVNPGETGFTPVFVPTNLSCLSTTECYGFSFLATSSSGNDTVETYLLAQ